jgi:hypothetical protein
MCLISFRQRIRRIKRLRAEVKWQERLSQAISHFVFWSFLRLCSASPRTFSEQPSQMLLGDGRPQSMHLLVFFVVTVPPYAKL